MSEEVIKLERVTAGYKVVKGALSIWKQVNVVLRDISFSIGKSERLAIIGESGSGKTTLLKVILGLLKPIKGSVLLYGRDIYRIPDEEREKILRKIGYVPQDPYRSLNPVLKVKTIIGEPLEVIGENKEKIEKRVVEVARFVGLPWSALDDTPEELSGGMRQRVLIARAIIANPEILVLDEPTSALDVSIQAQILNLLNNINSNFKPTMITVTHDLAVAQYLADRVIILKDGCIVEEGKLEEVLYNPRHEYTKTLVSSYLYTTTTNSVSGFNNKS